MSHLAHKLSYTQAAAAFQELHAIFAVIGTPEWACIELVENPRWRAYLLHLPALAPCLVRNFGFADEVALDLLRRLLAFDPSRRCVHLHPCRCFMFIFSFRSQRSGISKSSIA